jgi:hypothetical protein
VDIGGATSSTYVLVAADYANTIRCVVRATNSVAPAGVTANSNSTASVAGNAPVNTVAPAVTGTATVGQTLTTTNGTWTGVPTPTFTYQWQRVTTNISGATSSTYVLVAADAGNTIRCVVTATNAVSAVSANSNSTASVAATVPGAPTIGTATQTGATTATVAYTAPASNGGATITLYTATSSPGSVTGTLATAGSGTITVSGLTGGTSYTFTVKATNSVGQSAASAASNSITTPLAIGQAYGGGFFDGQISYNANSVATQNLVVAPKSTGQAERKFATANYTIPGASSTVDGAQNTLDAVADGDATKYPATYFIHDLVTGGFSDWYMAAIYEHEIIYYNLRPSSYPTVSNSTSVGTNAYSVPARVSNYTASNPAQTSVTAFQSGQSEAYTETSYWSSTDSGSNQWVASFYDGNQVADTKNQFLQARGIRKVAV